jgi:hypothetical protein
MKLDEVNDPTMKLQLELAKQRMANEERDQQIATLTRDVATLKMTIANLIRRLGPQQ